MKSLFKFLPFVVVLSGPSLAQNSAYKDYPISAVEINKVELTDNFWLPKIKTVQNTTIQFGFKKCEEEGRLENFLIAGGKMTGKTRGKMPFDDTDVYKLIEGASNSLISAPNKKLDAYLDSVIAIIKVGQQPDGYLTTWHTIDQNHPPAPWVKPGPRWKSEAMSHELYNAGHLYEAAATHYIATGKRNFLEIALRNADLLVKTFGPEPDKLQIPPGHQIVETGLVKLYRITGKEDYLKLAKFFLDQRGVKSNGRELYGPYSQDHLPVTQQTEAVGHAVRAVYLFAGMTDVAAIYDNKAYLNAVQTIWENMVSKKMYLTGGIGALHEGEAFGKNYELPNKTAYGETCAAIGDVYFNHRLFLLTGDSKYYDIIERTLYNGLISGISLSGDKFFYPNPLESDGKYAFNFGSCTRQPWFESSCCPTNLVRFVPAMPSLIYATQADNLFINLFAANKAQVKVNNTNVAVAQQTEYPWQGKITVAVNPEKAINFNLKIRIPGWARNEVAPGNLYAYADKKQGEVTVKVNGQKVNISPDQGYAVIARQWQKGDKVEVMLPMNIRQVITSNQVKENQNHVALEYGPLVYCAEAIDNNGSLTGIKVPNIAPLKVERRPDLLQGVSVISGQLAGKKFVAIPYYAWSNRGVNEMKVWLPKADPDSKN
ncbi:glycoside hydrolase family 127 protein [Adhaeribacter arboris]|uniref:Glycoside hydrolase family 127 protein n=1 Tax=Adhaeribacter arboris TaxID=2072846 RepID=A0A2T2YJS8_9BACT|nr:glycoside hydrolase family 127 protein [Adhaeribacter arboris]PSR55752.1 glycoside hydrolase family 127 protein [Adhaeribacter arboris]